MTWARRFARLRRLIASVLTGLAVLTALLTVRPAGPDPILVAARDLAPGVLEPGDLRAAPVDPPPDGALRSGGIGQVLATAMRKGEPLTDVRLLPHMPLPPGAVAAPVRIADRDAVRLIAPGSIVGVLAAWEGQSAQLVADDVRVVTIPASKDEHGALVVLAATPTQAGQLAAAQAGGSLSITIKPSP
ncbi:flagellar biosynthesis protein FlgA [Nonomuraea sediminis]|uniref:flagellar biosynthesis protein FlgA n=1 Tax=Nonomuraea sediminis TaxID=2835864 RepID=UPI001BDBFDDE|nr:flagellar biosynthesis protein FlgA [Nonomuraea sediminis]